MIPLAKPNPSITWVFALIGVVCLYYFITYDSIIGAVAGAGWLFCFTIAALNGSGLFKDTIVVYK